jgi:hypothetical protein
MSKALDNNKGHVRPDKEFGRAIATSVKDPVGDGLAKFECYLDNLFRVFRARDREKAEAVLPLALHLVGRRVDNKVPESFSRDNLLAVSKFLGRPFSVGRSTRGLSRSPSRRTKGAPGWANCEGWQSCPVEGPTQRSGRR